MAIPADAARFTRALDPHEELDFLAPCEPLLETGETIASYTLSVTAEGALLGLTIMSGAGRDHGLTNGNTAVKFWLTIDALEKDDVAFDAGAALPLLLTFETSSTPSRTRQRTMLITVRQQ